MRNVSTKTHLVFGLHSVQSLIHQSAQRILKLLIQEASNHPTLLKLADEAKAQHIAVEYVSRQTLDRESHEKNHQGVIAYTKPVIARSAYDLTVWLDELAKPPFLLILDSVEDPHNLGACFRVADGAGVDAIIVPKHHAVGITGTVSKVASGAVETVPFFQVTNLVHVIDDLKERGIWIYGASTHEGESIDQVKFTDRVAIVLGGESKGLRRLTREHCDVLIHIPMHGIVSSLNVSVAAGIILFTVSQKRKGMSV